MVVRRQMGIEAPLLQYAPHVVQLLSFLVECVRNPSFPRCSCPESRMHMRSIAHTWYLVLGRPRLGAGAGRQRPPPRSVRVGRRRCSSAVQRLREGGDEYLRYRDRPCCYGVLDLQYRPCSVLVLAWTLAWGVALAVAAAVEACCPRCWSMLGVLVRATFDVLLLVPCL